MGDAGGFGVTPEALRAVRDLLGLAAADVISIRGRWDAGTRELGAALAVAECGRAFVGFLQYLFETVGSRRDVLEALALASGDSAVTYDSADGTGTGQFGSLGHRLP